MQGSHQDLWMETQIPQRVYLCLIAPLSVISSVEKSESETEGEGALRAHSSWDTPAAAEKVRNFSLAEALGHLCMQQK